MPQPRTTKPTNRSIEESIEQDVNFSWDTFIKDCANNNYILVIGNEAVLNKDVNIEANGNSLNVLFNRTKEYIREKHGLTDHISTNFTQLSRNVANLPARVLDTIKKKFKFAADSVYQEIEPSLLALLKTKCFRVVLTTTVDPYVEIAMKHVWGENGFRVMNIYDGDDLCPHEQKYAEYHEIQPTLYYVFGKANPQNQHGKFVLSENDAMSLIPKWFSNERPKELLTYIQGDNMQIISVGCKYDDWLFRFFWFILRGKVENLSSGQVAVEFHEEDRKLVHYLQQENIKLFPDARAFMKEAATRIEEALNIQNLPRKTGGIFISYAHEDKYIALPLFYQLSKQGYSVWIDERLDEGDTYNLRISNAINNCKVFMPILSTQVMHDLINDNARYYRMIEWHIAQIRHDNESMINHHTNNMQVLPVVIGEYQVGSHYHQKAEKCIVNVTAFEVAKESFESLKQSINRLL